MALNDYPSGRGIPNRDAVEKALIAVGQQADGGPLGPDEIKRMPDEHLVGYLDALTTDLAEKVSSGPGGTGNSRHHLVLSGRRRYVESGRLRGDMDVFFASRAESLAADIRSWSTLRTM